MLLTDDSIHEFFHMRVGTGILLMILLMSTRERKNTTDGESKIAGLHALLDEVMWMMQSDNVNDAKEVFNE